MPGSLSVSTTHSGPHSGQGHSPFGSPDASPRLQAGFVGRQLLSPKPVQIAFDADSGGGGGGGGGARDDDDDGELNEQVRSAGVAPARRAGAAEVADVSDGDASSEATPADADSSLADAWAPAPSSVWAPLAGSHVPTSGAGALLSSSTVVSANQPPAEGHAVEYTVQTMSMASVLDERLHERFKRHAAIRPLAVPGGSRSVTVGGTAGVHAVVVPAAGAPAVPVLLAGSGVRTSRLLGRQQLTGRNAMTKAEEVEWKLSDNLPALANNSGGREWARQRGGATADVGTATAPSGDVEDVRSHPASCRVMPERVVVVQLARAHCECAHADGAHGRVWG